MNKNYGKRWDDLQKAINSMPVGVDGMASIRKLGVLNVFICNTKDHTNVREVSESFKVTPKGLKEATNFVYDSIKIVSEEPALTKEVEADREEFYSIYEGLGCTCFIAPPCGYCIHPGNPRNQAEDEDSWVGGVIGDCEGW